MELLTPTRRGFMGILGGALSFLAAPAIVRASSIMPVKAILPDHLWVPRTVLDDAERSIGLRCRPSFEIFGRDIVRLEDDTQHNRLLMRFVQQQQYQRPVERFDGVNSQWLFEPRKDGHDYLNGVDAPESWS